MKGRKKKSKTYNIKIKNRKRKYIIIKNHKKENEN